MLGAYLGKLRDIAAAELKNTVSDVVIAVPGWFTDIQRRAVLDAASIANLNTLRLMNDTTAVAFGYGITKSDLPEDPENARHVVFIDIGHSSLSVSVAAFSKGQVAIKATAYEPHLGGRDIDYALVQHFAVRGIANIMTLETRQPAEHALSGQISALSDAIFTLGVEKNKNNK